MVVGLAPSRLALWRELLVLVLWCSVSAACLPDSSMAQSVSNHGGLHFYVMLYAPVQLDCQCPYNRLINMLSDVKAAKAVCCASLCQNHMLALCRLRFAQGSLPFVVCFSLIALYQ